MRVKAVEHRVDSARTISRVLREAGHHRAMELLTVSEVSLHFA
jgi:hypothetical protein